MKKRQNKVLTNNGQVLAALLDSLVRPRQLALATTAGHIALSAHEESKGSSEEAEGTLHPSVLPHGKPFRLKPGWSVPEDIVPSPTYWPVVMALGITLIAFGIVTTLLITLIGGILIAISLVGWMGDIQDEQRKHGGD